jgi:hypothetical protein
MKKEKKKETSDEIKAKNKRNAKYWKNGRERYNGK